MPGNYSVPTRASGSILTATIYNGDHALHVTYNTPGGCDDASATVAAMQAIADPGEIGTESLSTDLLGEIERLRNMVVEITGKTYWYETPEKNLSQAYAKGADIALASTLVPVGSFEFADVTGSGINVTAIQSATVGVRLKLRLASAVNFIHDGTSLILPFGKIYRTYAGEFLTFESLGSGNWILSDYSGPHEPPGMGRDFLGASAPVGFVLQDNASLDCTDLEGLFTELVANTDQEGYDAAVGTCTADDATDIITLGGHGFASGDVVHFSSNNTLPAGLSAKTIYYVRDVAADTFKVTATRGGAAVDITDTGTGTHSCYNTFLAPDSRGRVDIGLDGAANRITSASTNGANADTLRGVGGTQTHTLTEAELAVHDHVGLGSIKTDDGNGNFLAPPAPTALSGTLGGDTVTVAYLDTADAGSGNAHSNTQPWRAVTKVVRV